MERKRIFTNEDLETRIMYYKLLMRDVKDLSNGFKVKLQKATEYTRQKYGLTKGLQANLFPNYLQELKKVDIL